MLFDQIASNKRKTWILLLVFFLLLALVGYAVGYRTDYRLYLRFVYDFSIDRDCHVHEWSA